MRKRYEERKNKAVRKIIFYIILIIISTIIIKVTLGSDKQEKTKTAVANPSNLIETLDIKSNNDSTNEVISNNADTAQSENKTIDQQDTIIELGWNLTLVNYENKMPDDYEVQLENIDQSRKFDSRAIGYLNNMIKDMKADGATNIWPQSTYRSIELQEELYNNKVQYFRNIGKSEQEAKALTEKVINKPGYSDHNLGLAVDFNYVKESFKDTKEYAWLLGNAEEYGFILRYPKGKEDITKVSYEPWHWRFVGIEHAKEMNDLGMCLEEYIAYLNE